MTSKYHVTKGMSAAEKLAFWSRQMPSGCIEYTGTAAKSRYGHKSVNYEGSTWAAHRLSWFLSRGPIPKGKCVLHECDNPPCINLDHLFLGTRGDNNRDMKRKGRARTVSRPGESNPAARLTSKEVLLIRADSRFHAEIAKSFGVSPSMISSIKRRVTWRHLP